MKKIIGYTVAFVAIFTAIQIWPLSESSFTPATPWDILVAAAMCARASQLSETAVESCTEISETVVATALGEIVGDVAFVGFVLAVYYVIQRRINRKRTKMEQEQSPS